MPHSRGRPRFRDFVVLYIAEGYKRCRNTVSVGNSDPAVIRQLRQWMRRFGRNPVTTGSSTTPTRTSIDLRALLGAASWA